MQKDGAVLFMTIICLIMIGGIMLFGVIENARYSGFKQTAVDKSNVTYVAGREYQQGD